MWPFSKKTPPAPAPEKKEPTLKGGFFSTDNVMQVRNPGAFIERNAFQRTASDFVTSDGTMDDLGGGIKSAFTTGQQAMNQNLLAWYVSQGFIGYQACALIAQHWLVDKACSQAPRDALRNGYEITSNDGTELSADILADIKKMDIQYGVNAQMEQFARFNRVFGIRIALFQVDSTDPDYYEKPFNIDGVQPGSYKGISQIDPYWITPELNRPSVANPESRHFYEPTWWRISGKRYHRSHLVIIRGPEVADILKPSYIYGGMPMTQQIYERVYAAERTANEAPQLAMTKRLTTLKTDTAAALADQEKFESSLSRWVYYRDNYGVKVIGGDEEIQQFDTALGELDSVIMTQYQLVAAIAKTPATKLMGTQPKGFSATGEFDEASYHEELKSIQTHELQPLLQRHHLLTIKSIIAPKYGIQPFAVEVIWNKLDEQTAKEKADTNLVKAQTDQALQAAGAIDGEDIRKRIMNDPDSGYNGMTEEEPIIEELEEEGNGVTTQTA